MIQIDKANLVRQLGQHLAGLRDGNGPLTDADIQARLEAAIAETLAQGAAGHTRRVTILLSDLRGFTAVAQRCSALQMMEVLNRYLGRMTEVIVAHGGTIDKFMGDAVMALFGSPAGAAGRDGPAGADDVSAALACAIEMQVAMDDLNREHESLGLEPLYMGIGLNTGEVVAGRLGSELHSEYTVIGDEVNLASRIEAHSLRGQILMSENTWRLARDHVEVGDVNEVRVKGRSGVVRMFELLAMRHPRALAVPRRDVRRSLRVQVDQPVRFRLVDGKSVAPEELTGHLLDLGYGGLKLISPVALEPYTDIRLSVLLSVLSPEPTEIDGKIVRVEPAPAGVACQVSFTSIELTAQQAIKDFVDGAIQARSG